MVLFLPLLSHHPPLHRWNCFQAGDTSSPSSFFFQPWLQVKVVVETGISCLEPMPCEELIVFPRSQSATISVGKTKCQSHFWMQCAKQKQCNVNWVFSQNLNFPELQLTETEHWLTACKAASTFHSRGKTGSRETISISIPSWPLGKQVFSSLCLEWIKEAESRFREVTEGMGDDKKETYYVYELSPPEIDGSIRNSEPPQPRTY